MDRIAQGVLESTDCPSPLPWRMGREAMSNPRPWFKRSKCSAAHPQGSWGWKYRQKRAAAKPESNTPALTPLAVPAIADPDNLIAVFHQLKQEAGQAPGLDGMTYSDWSRREVAAIMRGLCKAILNGTYRPQPSRLVRLPKGGGKFRTLNLRVLCDRVVSKALNNDLSPLWEGIFLDHSIGFRPGRGTWDLLARLESAVVQDGRWVLAVDDIEKAFDNVLIDDLMEDHRQVIQDQALLQLVESSVRGHLGQERRVGIDQGAAYSPTCLNARLHFSFDLPYSEGSNPSWWRYADNLVFACQDVSEGNQALNKASDLLQRAGFKLKGEDGPPLDLRQEDAQAQILGLTLRSRGNNLVFGIGSKAWEGIEKDLARAHEAGNPPQVAQEVIRGWVNYLGLAFESMGRKPSAGYSKAPPNTVFGSPLRPRKPWSGAKLLGCNGGHSVKDTASKPNRPRIPRTKDPSRESDQNRSRWRLRLPPQNRAS